MNGPKPRSNSPPQQHLRTIQTPPAAAIYRQEDYIYHQQVQQVAQGGYVPQFVIQQQYPTQGGGAGTVTTHLGGADMNKSAQMQAMAPHTFAVTPGHQFQAMHQHQQPRPTTHQAMSNYYNPARAGQVPRMPLIQPNATQQSQPATPHLVNYPMVGYGNTPSPSGFINIQHVQQPFVTTYQQSPRMANQPHMVIQQPTMPANFVSPAQTYYNPQNQGLFYPQNQPMMMTPQPSVSTAPTHQLQHRERKVLKIIDPDNPERNVMDEVRKPGDMASVSPHSTDSSARMTPAITPVVPPPPVTKNSDIAVQFMNQVAAKLEPAKKKISVPSDTVIQDTSIPPPVPDLVVTTQLNYSAAPFQSPPKDYPTQQQPEYQHQPGEYPSQTDYQQQQQPEYQQQQQQQPDYQQQQSEYKQQPGAYPVQQQQQTTDFQPSQPGEYPVQRGGDFQPQPGDYQSQTQGDFTPQSQYASQRPDYQSPPPGEFQPQADYQSQPQYQTHEQYQPAQTEYQSPPSEYQTQQTDYPQQPSQTEFQPTQTPYQSQQTKFTPTQEYQEFRPSGEYPGTQGEIPRKQSTQETTPHTDYTTQSEYPTTQSDVTQSTQSADVTDTGYYTQDTVEYNLPPVENLNLTDYSSVDSTPVHQTPEYTAPTDTTTDQSADSIPHATDATTPAEPQIESYVDLQNAADQRQELTTTPSAHQIDVTPQSQIIHNKSDDFTGDYVQGGDYTDYTEPASIPEPQTSTPDAHIDYTDDYYIDYVDDCDEESFVERNIPVVIGNRPDAPRLYEDREFYIPASDPTEDIGASPMLEHHTDDAGKSKSRQKSLTKDKDVPITTEAPEATVSDVVSTHVPESSQVVQEVAAPTEPAPTVVPPEPSPPVTPAPPSLVVLPPTPVAQETAAASEDVIVEAENRKNDHKSKESLEKRKSKESTPVTESRKNEKSKDSKKEVVKNDKSTDVENRKKDKSKESAAENRKSDNKSKDSPVESRKNDKTRDSSVKSDRRSSVDKKQDKSKESTESRKSKDSTPTESRKPEPKTKESDKSVEKDIQKDVHKSVNKDVNKETDVNKESDVNKDKDVVKDTQKDVKTDVKTDVKSDVNAVVDNGELPRAPTPTTQGLRYEYKEDQWSPLNPEGKKQYDRSFLLAIQFSTESLTKPADLPIMDIVLDKPLRPEERRQQHSSPPRLSSYDFTPQFARQHSGHSGQHSAHSHSRGGGGDRNLPKRGSREQQNRMKEQPRRVITPASMIPVEVKLKTTENAWKPRSKDEKADDPVLAETEDIYKKVRSILNKLTPQKFDTLVDQVSCLNVNNEVRLRGVVDLMFNKAIDEPAFSVAYANMCKKLSLDGFRQKIDTKLFKNILLTKCQKEFEMDKAAENDVSVRQAEIDAAPASKKVVLQEDLQIHLMKVKRRTLGNIRFIGELYKLKMLNDRVMHGCIKGLLVSDEEKLECLCRLMSTIGKELDASEGSKRVMDDYFGQMRKIADKRVVSSRIRFMLQDSIELKKNNWVPRREDAGPKTITELHKDIKQEQAKELLKQSTLKHAPPPKPMNPRGGRMGGGGSDEWQNVSAKPRNTIDSSKFAKIGAKQNNTDTEVQLGPPKFSNWGRGASSTKSQEPEKIDQRNRFSILGSSDDDTRSRTGMGRSPARNDSRGYPPYSGRGSGAKPNVPRGSMEKDREKERALASAKSLRNTPQPSSRGASRENSASRPTPTPTPPPPKPTELSPEKIIEKSKNTINEYISCQDLGEAILCVKELNKPSLFVSSVFTEVVERSVMARQHTAKLLHQLVIQKVLSVPDYIGGFNEVMAEANDIAVDAPKIWEYLGEMLGPMILDRTVPLALLRDSILKAEHKSGELMSKIIHFCASQVGHEEVEKIWRESNLQWDAFLPKFFTLDEFLKEKKLEFTVIREQHSKTITDLHKIKEGLDSLLKKGENNEIVFTWIEEHVDKKMLDDVGFIRVLMTCVCDSAIIEKDCHDNNQQLYISYLYSEANFKTLQRDALLMKYLDHKPDRELHAMYALQELVNRIDFPPGLLLNFFDVLYDEDVISEDAFKQWLESKEPAADMANKGVAEKQVKQFFDSLNDTES